MGVNAASAEEHALRARFQEVCEGLASKDNDDPRFQKPLAFWTRSSDRRLPYVLLERQVGRLIRTPFEDLFATPGIGHKKLRSLVMLLERVRVDLDSPPPDVDSSPSPTVEPVDTFDAALVSQQQWADWCEAVRRHRLEDELLGRIAPSLAALPTVIWRMPLRYYVDRSLSELRSLKTHGEKRVATVIEVLGSLYRSIRSVETHPRLSIRLAPAFVPPAESWLRQVTSNYQCPQLTEVREHVALPLLNQLQLDAGEVVHRLAVGRLGIESNPESVREQAARGGITRARVYQLLEVCGQVMDVRWPEGRWQFTALRQQLDHSDADTDTRDFVAAIQGLFFPSQSVPDRVRRRSEATDTATAGETSAVAF